MSISTAITQLTTIAWREPLWLLLATVPVFLSWLHTLSRTRKTHYADTHLLPWATAQQTNDLKHRLLSKNSAFIVAWLLLSIAAAGPRTPLELAEPEQASNLDIMLVVDVSRSMQVTDISPSRIRRAQIELDELITRAPGNRIGIIAFAARPHLLAPLTSDMSALRFYLRTLDTLTLPTTGSNPLAALELAELELDNSSNPSAILMLTDGDFSLPKNPSSSLSKKSPMYILGLGTTEGAAIPREDGQWLKHEGRAVISRLNEKTLRALIEQHSESSNNHQQYITVTDDDHHWRELYDNGIAQLNNKSINTDKAQRIIWQQHYHWALCMAVFLLWLSLSPYVLHPNQRLQFKNKLPKRPPHIHAAIQTTLKTTLITCGLFLLSLYSAQQAFASSTEGTENETAANINQAYKDFINGNYLTSINAYKQLTGFTARFGEGASHYKLEDYTHAIRQFSLAILAADNDQQRANAIFNLGNSYFQNGNYANAIRSYADVLKYHPADKRTQHNLNFSIALKKAVDEHLRKRQNAARMGSGPQLSPSAATINANPSGSMAIDETESQGYSALPELAKLSNHTLQKLINKGLEKIQLAAITDSKLNTQYQRSQLSFINARIRMSELEDQHDLLWKRLFEMEEGFPAPLAEPRNIPGVPAW